MASSARGQFIDGFKAFRDATQENCVIANDHEGRFLRRGLAVAVYSLLEQFVHDRIVELVDHMNTGALEFKDLDEKFRVRALRRAIAISSGRLRFVDDLDLPAHAQRLGRSLDSSAGKLGLTPATWHWASSNMGDDDYSTALTLFHVNQPFLSVLRLSGRLGFSTTGAGGADISLRQTLADFNLERNRAAHQASYNVTSLWLRGIASTVLRFAVCFDALGSTSAAAARRSDVDYINNPKWNSSDRIAIRMLQERPGSGWAERREGASRALRIFGDYSSAFSDAATRCGLNEILVAYDPSKQIVNWCVPSVG